MCPCPFPRLHIAEKQVAARHDAQVGDNRLEALRIHPIRRNDACIETDKLKDGYPRRHAVVYGAAQHVGNAPRCARHALKRLGHGDGIQRREPHADHEGNGNDGPADAGEPSHEARKPAQQEQGQPLHVHGAMRHIETGFLKGTEHIQPREDDLHGKDISEPDGRQIHIGLGSRKPEKKRAQTQRESLHPIDTAFPVVQPCPQNGHKRKGKQRGRHRLMHTQ